MRSVHVAVFLVRIGTANVARNGCSIHQPLCHFLDSHPIDVVALPEADVPAFSSVGFCNSWRPWGRFAALSAPVDGRCRVALVSSIPMRQVSLRAQECHGRYVAALLDLGSPHQVETILVVGVYLQNGNEATAAGQFEDILQLCLQTGFRFVMVGDFNLTPAHEVLIEHVAGGSVSLADDCRLGEVLPATGPVYRGTRRRRIDFALQHKDLYAQQVHHAEGPSDHLIVYYDFCFQLQKPRHGPPRRPFCTSVSESDISAAVDCWCPRPFYDALRIGDLDRAWQLLSNCAEDALCVSGTSGNSRADAWDPSSPSLSRSGKSPERSAGLRALLRLSSRVQVYLQRPFDVFLRVRIFRSLRGVRKLVPELPFTHLIDSAFHRALQDLVCQYVRQENEAGKQRWRLRVRDNECSLPASGCHPAVEIDKQASIWNSRWEASDHAGVPGIAPFLAHIPQPGPCQIDFTFTADALRRAAARIKGKSPGPDAWTSEALTRLPPAWWQFAADLWNRAMALRRTPDAWTRGKTCLLWKDDRKTRPITVLPVIWRAGAQLLNRWLASWALSWRGSFDCGGLPGSSVASALQMLQHELHQGCRLAIQQDVSGYFDCLEHELTCAVLRHLRAPEPFVALFEYVCSSSTRIFCLQGAWSETWIHPRRGLPQGCPLSPLVSAAMTHAWACWVFGSSVSPQSPINGLGYIDDRLLLLRANHEITALRSAVSRSGQFDRAFGLEVSLKKCAVVAACNDCEARQLAASLDYQFNQTIQTLGVQATWGPPWGLLRFSLHKSVVRLRLMRSLSLSSQRSRRLVRSLVTPGITWAAAYASPDREELRALQKEVEACMYALAGHGSAKVLFYEIMGWWLCPHFALDEATLRELWRCVVRPHAWTEELPLSLLQGWTIRSLPNVPQLLSRLGWSFSSDSRCLHCCDAEGHARTIRVGFESFSGVRQWLVAHYRRLFLAKLDRLWCPVIRPADYAVGLQLPPPDADAVFNFEGHKRAFREASFDRHISLACVAAGASCWHFNAGGEFSLDHPRQVCLCNKRLPSRPHLAWNCPCLPVDTDLQLPTDRAAERLFALPSGSQPLAPPAIDPVGFLEELADAIAPHLNSERLYLATDGSSKDGVGAMGWAIQFPAHTLATGDDLEDQSAFRLEMTAIHITFRALHTLLGRSRKDELWRCTDIVCVVDCWSAIQSLEGGYSFDMASLVQDVRRVRHALQMEGVAVQFLWTPSHGKRPDWSPAGDHDANLMRHLNAAADVAAGECMSRRLAGSARAAWSLRQRQIVAWEYKAIMRVANVSKRYHAHLLQFGRRPREKLLCQGESAAERCRHGPTSESHLETS